MIRVASTLLYALAALLCYVACYASASGGPRDARRLARLQAEGHTHSRCNRCHTVRVLSWDGGDCNESDPTTDSGLCEGVYRAVRGQA